MWNGEEEDKMSNKTGPKNWTHSESTMWIIMMTCPKIRQKNADKGSFKWEVTVQMTKKINSFIVKLQFCC